MAPRAICFQFTNRLEDLDMGKHIYAAMPVVTIRCAKPKQIFFSGNLPSMSSIFYNVACFLTLRDNIKSRL